MNVNMLNKSSNWIVDNGHILIPLQYSGWVVDVCNDAGEKIAEKSISKMPIFSVVMDAKLTAPILKKRIELTGLSSDEQRLTMQNKLAELKKMIGGVVKMNGQPAGLDAYERASLPLDATIAIDSTEVIVRREVKTPHGIVMRDADGNAVYQLYIKIPNTEEAIEKTCMFFWWLDGQHSNAAAGAPRNDMDGAHYYMNYYVYLDLTAEERTTLFDMKNFKQTKAKSSMRIDHEYAKGAWSDDRNEMYELIEALSSQRIRLDDAAPECSALYGSVKRSETDKRRNLVTRQQLMYYTMMTGNRQRCRTEDFEVKNTIQAMNDIGADTTDKRAKLVLDTLKIMNFVHREEGQNDNLFTTDTGCLSASKKAAAFFLMQPVFEVMASKHLNANRTVIAGLHTIMRDETLRGNIYNYDGFQSGGGSNYYTKMMNVRSDFMKVCEKITENEIVERGMAELNKA